MIKNLDFVKSLAIEIKKSLLKGDLRHRQPNERALVI